MVLYKEVSNPTLMKKIILIIVFHGVLFSAFSQSISFAKQTNALRIESTIHIDGQLDEADWQNAAFAKDFTNYNPNPGAASSQKSEVRILYNDKAIYIGATLYDTSPDSILRQLSERDQIGITDWFAVVLDPYRDGLNGFGFIVTAAGVQYDTRYSSSGGGNGGGFSVLGGDKNWDAVWQSEIRITDKGWNVEIKIPYSAIRFPKVDKQVWNINFARMIRREREESFWNEVKPEISGLLNQSGFITDIDNIKSPVRLSATPYIVTYLENNYDKSSSPQSAWGRSFSAGLDIKYGINDAFTLDMALIPDFGQTRSDNHILNLSPFEIKFDENRPFFTEGLELFQKGDLFYSRRVGGLPVKFFDAYDEAIDSLEEVVDNPLTSQLYNATKISGRTNKGLGIGFFNAVSQRTFATIKNLEDSSTRQYEINPLTNYNVFVLDQNLKNNSYVSLINTNVWRSGQTYDANVTGTEFLLRNEANSYAIGGEGSISQKFFSEAETAQGLDSIGLGYKYELGFGKTSGNFQYSLDYEVVSRHYDPNDLGFLLRPNFQDWEAEFNYNIFKPFGKFNRFGSGISINYIRLQDPNVFTDFVINWDGFFVTKGFLGFGPYGRIEPVETYDYYEPRTADFSRFYTYPTNWMIGSFASTDYRKIMALDVRINYRKFSTQGRNNFYISFKPRVRASDKLFILLELSNQYRNNDEGYVNPDESALGYESLGDNDIIFSIRDQVVFDNRLNIEYIFTKNMSLNFRVRHYWTKLDYNSFHLLGEDGYFYNTPYTGKDSNNNSLHNGSYNIFNIDLVYRWRFAPGSDLFFVWKNAIANQSPDIEQNYFNNIEGLLDSPQINSFSIKVIYYLDYLYFVKK